MTWLIVSAIRLYWLVAPQSLRDRCLFRETCSRHVMAIAQARGARFAVAAFRERWRQCRPGYRRLSIDAGAGASFVRLADGSVISTDDLSPRARAELGVGYFFPA